MYSFRRQGVSVIPTPSIHCFIKVSFRTAKVSWNMYFLNYLCRTWTHGWPHVDVSIALLSKSLTLPIDCTYILSNLLIMLIGFHRLCVAIYTETAYESTQSGLNNVCHILYVVSQCRPLDSSGLMGWLLFPIHSVIGGSVNSRNAKPTTFSKPEPINNSLQMYG